MRTLLVTGAAGFIGSALCRFLRAFDHARVIGIDKMSYASSRESLDCLSDDKNFQLVEVDICDSGKMDEIIKAAQPDGIMHLAAETHVDRSIDSPYDFIQNNIVGTFSLLEATRKYLASTSKEKREGFRFLHVSTDEVYGSLGETGSFTEDTQYSPNSPYAASKAGADHLARAWYKTFGVPVVISNCSNNYGPFQFPEKLIPLSVMKALNGEKIPIYGQGINVRDWLFVDDHAEALFLVLLRGRLGEKYNIGGASERRNIDLINDMCAVLDRLLPESPHCPHSKLITFVSDRPGHDERYSMDFSKLKNELGWEPKTNISTGLEKTVQWYINNRSWCEKIKYSGERLGQIK
ncbi:MAG: dTDP-glucose 4,6-dehydratase [Alphaproteobacteria bacterium]|nr:dTDP-glucose 4,6-dehydratase [Alphaproteobacteria bacterium]